MQYLKKLKPSAEVYGYVDIGITTNNFTLSQLEYQIQLWFSVIQVNGIFLDDMGYEFQTTRERQNTIIEHVHQHGSVIANAWNPEDVMGESQNEFNPSGAPSSLCSSDYYLSDNFVINTELYSANHGLASQRHVLHKEDLLQRFQQTYGIKLIACDCVDMNLDFSAVSNCY